MALSHGRLLSFWVSTPSGGSSAVIADTAEVNGLPGDVDLGDVTAAGTSGAYAHASYPGLQKASFTSVHNFNDATTCSFDVLGRFQTLQQTYPTVPWGITFGPRGTTTGAAKLTCNAWIKTITMPIKVTDPNKFTVSWEMTGSSGVTIGSY